MQTLKKALFYFLHKLWLILAVVVVLLAVLISVLRYSLPYADHYKHRLEQLIAEQYGSVVQIGEMTAAWQKFGPTLILKDLNLFAEQEIPPLYIAEIRVRINFWHSLMQRQLVAAHFELQGVTYYLDSHQILSRPQGVADTQPLMQALDQLFFHQLKYFSVLNSRLILQNSDDTDIVILVKQLNWRNDVNRHQGFGELSIEDVTASNLSFILDLHGEDRDKVFGQLYLESDQLDLLPLFRQLLPQTPRLNKADLNFKAWGRIDNGTLQRIQIELAQNRLIWQRDGTTHTLELKQGQLLWVPTETGWSLYSNELTLADQQQVWPDVELQLHQQHQQLQGSVDNFQIEAFEPLAHLLAEDSQSIKQGLPYQLDGHLEHLSWFLDGEQWGLTGYFSNFSSAPVHDIPGVKGLSGQFHAADNFAAIQLKGENSALSWDGLFAQELPYQTLELTLNAIRHAEQQWQVKIPQLQFQSEAFQAAAELSLDLPDAELALLITLSDTDAMTVAKFLPQRYLPEKTRQYLEQAIGQGQLQNSSLLWHGKVADFPYATGGGVFQVHAEVSDGLFEFDPGWPLLTGLGADIWLENGTLLLQSKQGYLADIPVQSGVSVFLNDIMQADSLQIAIQQQVDASSANELINRSPLADNLGKALQHIGLEGIVDSKVKLDVGLKQHTVQASGELLFSNNSARLQAPQMVLSAINGQLTFHNEQIRSDNLNVNWRDLPIKLSLAGEQRPEHYHFTLSADGQHQAAELLSALYPAAVDLAEGSGDWALQLAMQLRQDSFNYQAELAAKLDDITLTLPAPYTKTAGIPTSLAATISGNDDASFFAVNYADQLYFRAELQHQSQQISRARLMLGPDDNELNNRDFEIDIALKELDFIPWLELISSHVSALPETTDSIMPPLRTVQGEIEQLKLTDAIALHNTRFEVTQQPDWWEMQLHGKEIASRWQFYKDWQGKGIQAELDYLRLAVKDTAETEKVTEAEKETTADWWLHLPPVQLVCADCSMDSYHLGRVTANAVVQEGKWQLEALTANYKGNQLTLKGQWQPDAGPGISQFSGKLFSPNFGALLTEAQLTSAIAGSRTELDFVLNWAGAPHQFQLAELNGDVKFSLAEGSLTEVSDQGARLFSLFSLDSLLRKLRLDFRDVFSKGFFYNRISGGIQLNKGVAQTSDATVDGIPGNLSIQGYADLVSRKIDYQMSFAPKVTSSLPVIIAWMVNPVTGLAALALDEVFQSAEVISRINFTVTGTLDQPVVTEVNRHSTEIPVPPRITEPETSEAVEPDNPEQKEEPEHD